MNANVDVKNVALKRAIQMLNAAGVMYKVIGDDGTHYGELEVRPPKMRKGHSGPRTDLKTYYLPYVKDLQPADVAVIPTPEGIVGERIRSASQAWCIKQWGSGSTISSWKVGTNVVEILRVF